MNEVDLLAEAVTNDYTRSLEERVMQLEARVAQLTSRAEKNDLAADGYVRFPGYEPDRGACRNATCEKCGCVGMHYEPYRRQIPMSYRAFAVCPSCGHREEF